MSAQENGSARNDGTSDPVALAERLAREIAPAAGKYDRENRFAAESIALLQREGYAALTVPVRFGGTGAGLYDLVRAQEKLATGDAAVALAIGMSLLQIAQEASQPSWPQHLHEMVMREAVARGALVNSVASEPRMGSPSRGGKPETTAVPAAGGGWYITGRKNYATLAPVLDFIIVMASIEDGSGDVGRFLVERGEGIHVIETWDSLSMRATGSHDMLFERVYVPEGNLLKRYNPGAAREARERSGEDNWEVPVQNAYFALPVAAVYLGAALEAHQSAVRYAATRVPPPLGHPLSEVESIRNDLADNERELRVARMLLHDTARRVEASRGPLDTQLRLDIYAAKHTAANNAISVVDRSMRVLGGASLAAGNPLERAYRNVRAGLHNPPADDVTRRVLAEYTIRKYKDSVTAHS